MSAAALEAVLMGVYTVVFAVVTAVAVRRRLATGAWSGWLVVGPFAVLLGLVLVVVTASGYVVHGA